MTEGGAILCPDGHGRVLTNTEITERQLRAAERDRERWRWLAQFPHFKRITRRVYRDHDTGREYKRLKIKGESRLKWLETPPNWATVARADDGLAYYWQPLNEKETKNER